MSSGGGTYPVLDFGGFGSRKASSNLCPYQVRGVFAAASTNTAGDGGVACYAAAIAAVNSYDFEDVPWGKIYWMDYGASVSTCADSGPYTGLHDPGDSGIGWSLLTSCAIFNGPRTPYSFQVQKLQVLLPNSPWNVQAWEGQGISGPGRCCANDNDTDPSDPDHSDMLFYQATPFYGSGLVILPVPSWGDNGGSPPSSPCATYWLFPCQRCSPET